MQPGRWHEYEDLISELVDQAEKLLAAARLGRRRIPANIIALGQSPAWLVRTAGHLSTRYQRAHRFYQVPFSGKFARSSFDKRWNHKTERTFTISTPPYQQQFRAHLQAMGLAPATIIKDAVENQRATIIVDLVDFGGSLASFVHLLSAWAKEENCLPQFAAALRVHPIRINFEEPLNVLRFDDLAVRFRLREQRVSSEFYACFGGSFSDNDPDRLVPYYPHQIWNKPPGNGTGSPQLIEQLDKAILAEIATRPAPKQKRGIIRPASSADYTPAC